MDLAEKVWHEMPEDVVLTIVSFLPAKSLARFRAVNTSWHHLLSSTSFTGSCLHMRPLLFLNVKDSATHHRIFTLESPNKWQEFQFTYLPVASSSQTRVVAASVGLVCVQADSEVLFVCNPITKAWIKLPPLILGGYEYPVIGMIENRNDPSNYRVVVTGLKHTTEVYNSSTGQWRLIPGGKASHDSCTTFHQGILYSAGIAKILTYDVEEESWTEIDYPVPWPRLCAKRISECQGRLFLIASDSEEHSLIIWTLDHYQNSTPRWTRLRSLSLDRVHKLQEVDNRSLLNVGDDENCKFVFYAGFRKLMAFNLVSNTWFHFSRYPKDYPFNFFYKHSIFHLQPSLDASSPNFSLFSPRLDATGEVKQSSCSTQTTGAEQRSQRPADMFVHLPR
ncbi:hypothetical protein R1sor_018629 [Riccia sorocarpa]|uniref:F-box domain-containing protein n=1 Tax=Riccia sorocarpa TaxID=122646 RepID=A0ABD3IAA6_9MARC